jgi:hypothetical protein
MLGHKYYACTHLNICEKALALKEKEEQEEPKEESDCNDCYYSMQNCNDISICCEDETALCDNFEPVAKKKEEPKSDAEKFIDSLLETLVLRSKSLEFTDMWAISNTMLGYIDGKKAMIEDVIKIIKDYKEKK